MLPYIGKLLVRLHEHKVRVATAAVVIWSLYMLNAWPVSIYQYMYLLKFKNISVLGAIIIHIFNVLHH